MPSINSSQTLRWVWAYKIDLNIEISSFSRLTFDHAIDHSISCFPELWVACFSRLFVIQNRKSTSALDRNYNQIMLMFNILQYCRMMIVSESFQWRIFLRWNNHLTHSILSTPWDRPTQKPNFCPIGSDSRMKQPNPSYLQENINLYRISSVECHLFIWLSREQNQSDWWMNHREQHHKWRL
jgi:hypothetical protein